MSKIIEATAVINARDNSGAAFKSIADKMQGVAKVGDQVKKSLGGMAQEVSSRVGQINASLGKIDNFRTMSRGLDQAAISMKRANDEMRRVGSEIDRTARPSRALQQQFAEAATAVRSATEAFRQQGAAVRQAREALAGAGIPVNRIAAEQQRLTAALNATNAAMGRQAGMAAQMARGGPWGAHLPQGGRSPSGVPLVRQTRPGGAGGGLQAVPMPIPPGEAGNVGGMLGGALVVGGARRLAGKSIMSAADLDYAVRRQRAFVGVTKEEQDRILIPQAKQIGRDTQFTNTDVVEAQTEVARRLPADIKNAGVISSVVAQVRNYAQATKGVDMNQSAEAVTGFLTSTGKDISTAEKALFEARRATNLLIRMQKLGGLGHEDLMPFVSRGASAGRIAGLSDETMGAFAIGLRRNNITGDQAGTALRTLGSKLVAPTNKGLAALSTIGVDYDKFTNMPGGLSVDNLEGKFKRDFGKSFTPAIREKLAEGLADPDIIANRGDFTQFVSDAVSELFPKTKKGKIAASDAKAIAKKVGEFHKFSVESVNTEALLEAIIKADPSLAVLNAFATDKHGNKLGLVAKAFEQFQKDRADLRGVAPEYGAKIAEEISGGLWGAVTRLTGSFETLVTTMGSANEKWLTLNIDRLGNAIDKISELPEPIIRLGTEAGLAATALIALKTAAGLTNWLGNKPGAPPVIPIPGGGAPGGAPGAGLPGAKPGTGVPGLRPGGMGGGLSGGIIGWLLYQAGTEAIDYALKRFIGPPKKVDGYDPDTHNPWVSLWSAATRKRPDADPGFDMNVAYERSRRAQAELRQGTDMEASRGRGMMGVSQRNDIAAYGPHQVEAVVKPDQITAKAEVRGEGTVTVVIQPSGEFMAMINQARAVAKMPLTQTWNGPGSTGRSMPEAAAPQVGSAPRGDR